MSLHNSNGNHWSLLTFLGLAIVVVITNFTLYPNNILSWDVFGYYLYLSQGIVEGDLLFNEPNAIYSALETYNSSSTLYQAYPIENGNWVIRTTGGMAIMYLPFFLLGHLLASVGEWPVDGFSYPYQLSMVIGSAFYTILGIWYLRKVLLHFSTDRVVAIVLIIVALGTNYYYNNAWYGSGAMPHNYLFTLYSIIVWHTIKWHDNPNITSALVLSVCCAIAILARPTEVVCLLIPILWKAHNRESLRNKIVLIRKYRWQLVMVSTLLLTICLTQVLYWKICTGNFYFNGYGIDPGVGLDLHSPNIINVLFSYRKGWLIYTPIAVLGISGIVLVYKKHKSCFYAVIIYLLVNIYLVSSWSFWWYGECFGQRALIPSYVILAIPLALLIEYVANNKSWIKVSGIIVIIVFTALNLFQTWQFSEGIIDGSRMTKAYYWKVFGTIKKDDSLEPLLLINRTFDGREEIPNNRFFNQFELANIDFEIDGVIPQSFRAHSGESVSKLDGEYSIAISSPFNNLTEQYYCWIKASVWIRAEKSLEHFPISFVVTTLHNGYAYKYRTVDTETLGLNENVWHNLTMEYLTPEIRDEEDEISVYVWNRGGNTIYIDDMSVTVYHE